MTILNKEYICLPIYFCFNLISWWALTNNEKWFVLLVIINTKKVLHIFNTLFYFKHYLTSP